MIKLPVPCGQAPPARTSSRDGEIWREEVLTASHGEGPRFLGNVLVFILYSYDRDDFCPCDSWYFTDMPWTYRISIVIVIRRL